jgi:peptide/nickel transport system permease protein
MKLSAKIATGFLVLVILIAVFAPVIAPDAPNAEDLSRINGGVVANHLLGTDSYGRDILSRLIWGARPALLGVALALAIALVLGVSWGATAGYFPRTAGPVLMRAADGVLAFPAIVLSVAITGALGPGLVTSMASVGIVFAPYLARLTYSGVQAAMTSDYVASARLSGCPARVILIRHALGSAMNPVLVQTTVFAGLAFIVEAALSFLGLGVQPPTPSWGGMLSDAYQDILVAPWQIVPPGVLTALVVLAIYRCGDELRDRQGERDRTVAKRETSVLV